LIGETEEQPKNIEQVMRNAKSGPIKADSLFATKRTLHGWI
jgi:hypothetical protein